VCAIDGPASHPRVSQLSPSVAGGISCDDGIVRYAVGPCSYPRRYNEFVALHNACSAAYCDTETLVPQLPFKPSSHSRSCSSPTPQYGAEFIRGRRHDLDGYLRCLCSLPGAAFLPPLQSFLHDVIFNPNARPCKLLPKEDTTLCEERLPWSTLIGRDSRVQLTVEPPCLAVCRSPALPSPCKSLSRSVSLRRPVRPSVYVSGDATSPSLDESCYQGACESTFSTSPTTQSVPAASPMTPPVTPPVTPLLRAATVTQEICTPPLRTTEKQEICTPPHRPCMMLVELSAVDALVRSRPAAVE